MSRGINWNYVRKGWLKDRGEMRSGFGTGLVREGEKNERLVVLTADLGESLRLGEFRRRWPERYLNVGVAEQNMVGVAAGLAAEGWVPVATSFGVFSPGRNWDQVRVSVAYSQANVKLVGSHGGIATGEDGATHQALEDVAMMRVLPGMSVVAPCDEVQAKMAVKAMASHVGPVYLRLVRPRSMKLSKERRFEIGKAYVYRWGKEVTVLAYGLQVGEAMVAAEELSQEGVEVEVVNVATIKPLDEEVICRSLRKTGRVVVAEDHQRVGGLGSAVAELVARRGLKVEFRQVGIDDVFGESGDWRGLYQKYGLDSQGIKWAIERLEF